VALTGDVGVGKTVFTRGLVEGIGYDTDVFVASPSYIIVHEYETRIPIFHIDLYRLDEDSLEELALHEYMDSHHISVIEWAPKIQFLPSEFWVVSLNWISENERNVEISRQRDISSLQG